jgi:hypothetical protein
LACDVPLPGALISLDKSNLLLILLQTKEQAFDGGRIPSLVHYCIDVNRFARGAVINKEREHPGNHAVKTEKLTVASVMKEQ